MRIIREAQPGILKLWGKSFQKDTEYRLIQYHIRTECDNGLLLLNTITGELVLLNSEEAKMLEGLPKVPNQEMQELIAKRFLVPRQYNELKVVDQLRSLLRKLRENGTITSYNILPTTSCNARCFYCFESDYEHHSMTAETADKVADYIVQHCGSAKKVELHWFGGEPTLGEKRIDQICDRLIENGVSYNASMISNGYLFSPEMVKKAVDKWNLRTIQITLDGTETVYNRTKAYVNVEGSPYQRVVKNIGLLLEHGVRVAIRMNLDFHNEENLRVLIEELAERFAGKGQLVMYVDALFENVGFQPVRHSELERRALIYKKEALNALIQEKGIPRESKFESPRIPSLLIPFCMADNPSSLQVNPLGQFGKCEHEIFTKLVGNIDSGFDVNSEQTRYWLTPEFRQECKHCGLYPYCGKPVTCEGGMVCHPEQMRFNIIAAETQILHYYQERIIKNMKEKENTNHVET